MNNRPNITIGPSVAVDRGLRACVVSVPVLCLYWCGAISSDPPSAADLVRSVLTVQAQNLNSLSRIWSRDTHSHQEFDSRDPVERGIGRAAMCYWSVARAS